MQQSFRYGSVSDVFHIYWGNIANICRVILIIFKVQMKWLFLLFVS